MQLLTKEIEKQFPEWMSTDGKGMKNTKAICKFFAPGTGWTWYAVEYDGEDTFFGYVVGMESEFGYFSLSELSELRYGPGNSMKVERDTVFEPTTMDIIIAQHK